MIAQKRYEVVTDEDCLILYAQSHKDAKAIAERKNHKVFATINIEPDAYISDEKIWDVRGYEKALS